MNFAAHMLANYGGKKVAVLYSAGLDSTFLAYHLKHTALAKEVALIIFDTGAHDNDPKAPYPDYNPDKPADFCSTTEQMVRYANHMKKDGNVDAVWTLRAPHFNSLIVKPDNLKAPDTEAAADCEANHGLDFYSGLVLNMYMIALSTASAHGYDFIVTGHMGWNSHYADESDQCATDAAILFKKYYGSRLKTVPEIEQPYRLFNMNKADVIKANHELPNSIDPIESITCRASVMTYLSVEPDVALGYRLKRVNGREYQYHCGVCEHCIERINAFKEADIKDTAFFI